MKKFHIKIWFTENDKKQEIVQHDGLTFEEICAIENFIEAIKHRTGTLDELMKTLSNAKSYKDAFKLK